MENKNNVKKQIKIKKYLNKKSIITIVIISFVVIIFLYISQNSAYIAYLRKWRGIDIKQQEEELINLDIEIKKENTDSYNCLLTFESNDENEKIKSIEYPTKENEKPNIIAVNNEEGKQKIAIDYIISKENNDVKFKLNTTKGNVIEKRTGYTIKFDTNGGGDNFYKTELIGVNKINLLENIPEKDGFTFYGWSTENNSIISDYEDVYTNEEKMGGDVTLYAVWRKNNEKVSVDSLINAAQNINETCQIGINIQEELYDADFIVHNGNLSLDGNTQIQGATLNQKTYEFGNKLTDTAKENKYAKNMVILKVNGDLTIDDGVTLTACKNSYGYGGPKGMILYVTGTITNNGTISMTARGAYAEGKNVYLWKNTDNTYEYIPAVGGDGGVALTSYLGFGDGKHVNGNDGNSAETNSRKTAGGGSGKIFSYTYNYSRDDDLWSRRKWYILFRRNWRRFKFGNEYRFFHIQRN